MVAFGRSIAMSPLRTIGSSWDLSSTIESLDCRRNKSELLQTTLKGN